MRRAVGSGFVVAAFSGVGFAAVAVVCLVAVGCSVALGVCSVGGLVLGSGLLVGLAGVRPANEYALGH